MSTGQLTRWEDASEVGERRLEAEWNDAHSAEITPAKPKEKHKFSIGRGCAELNTDRFEDPEKLLTDNWSGGFYMEVYVDGWDVDKTITLDFHTAEIEFPKHACQNVRIVGYTETTVTLVVIQQRWICCESFGCALRGNRPDRISFTCGVLGSPPPSPPPLPMPPPPPSPPKPRPPPPPSPPPPPHQMVPPSPPPPPITRVTELGVFDPMYGTASNEHATPQRVDMSALAIPSIYSPPPPPDDSLVQGPMAQGAGMLAVVGFLYMYANSRGLLPWSKSKGEKIPQGLEAAKQVRAKPKKVDVQVERNGELESTLEVSTKGLTSVSELGERLAEQMVTELDIEDSFKLYYVDNEGDSMLVSHHTGIRDLLYSECITAKVDLALPEPPRPEREKTEEKREKKKKTKPLRALAAPSWDS